MKHLKYALMCSLVVTACTCLSYGQDVLPEVTVMAVKYKYLKAVDNSNAPQPVKMLEKKAAVYDVKQASFYEDDFDTYFVSFFIPAGEILATYDNNGKLLRTAEKFNDVALPPAVRDAVGKKYPQWGITKDVYLVNYYEDEGAKKIYKLILENGSKRMRVKANEKGEFM